MTQAVAGVGVNPIGMPDFVLNALRRQLIAASAIWPELVRARVEMESAGTEFARILEEAKDK